MTTPPVELRLLATAGRLLLEYNESTAEIHRILNATAEAITGEKLAVTITYGGIAVELGAHPPRLLSVPELRYNAAIQARVHAILARIQRRELDPTAALAELKQVETTTPRHASWLVALVLGLAAASLAALLGADRVAIVAAGIATAIGLVVRRELARRHFRLLTLPCVAAFIGAAIGALAIRCGWTQTPGLIVIVPSLMIVPGPHLINALIDLVDNYLPMSLARFGLAVAILLSSALGVVIGMEVLLPNPPDITPNARTGHLNLPLDMLLAGIVTSGFALFYNVAWKHVGMAMLGGMIGHGLRYIALDFGWNMQFATFLGALAVGVVSAWISRSYKVPFAVIAFAGAVTMMPGVQMYRSLRGLLQLARDSADLPAAAATLSDGSQAFLIVCALGLGLIVAIRVVDLFFDASLWGSARR